MNRQNCEGQKIIFLFSFVIISCYLPQKVESGNLTLSWPIMLNPVSWDGEWCNHWSHLLLIFFLFSPKKKTFQLMRFPFSSAARKSTPMQRSLRVCHHFTWCILWLLTPNDKMLSKKAFINCIMRKTSKLIFFIIEL